MSKTTKLTVQTDVGTFTRKTVRTYTHLVAVCGVRAEVLEAGRLTEIASRRRYAAQYAETVRTGVSADDTTAFHREHTAKCIADGSYTKWIAEYLAHAEELEAQGPITADTGGWLVLGWCGRLDLARKLAVTDEADRYRWVRVYDVATGEQHSATTHGQQTPETVLAQRKAAETARRRRQRRFYR